MPIVQIPRLESCSRVYVFVFIGILDTFSRTRSRYSALYLLALFERPPDRLIAKMQQQNEK